MSVRLFESLATTERLAEVFSDASLLASMLRFEIALARAEAGAGLIPATAAQAIERGAGLATFDPAAIARAARDSGTITIAFVDRLTACVREVDATAAAFVHRGATSQDVSDTALVLCLLRASALLTQDHERLVGGLRRLSEDHAQTVMLARTLLQPAPPTTFGLKAAGWFGAVSRSGAQMAAAFDSACVLQFGGASGTLSALGRDGLRVAAALARDLDLREPDAPWHANRDRLASLVTACGVYTGVLGKIARDVSLLMQHEVAEASEPGGASSTMPHKRNPAGCAVALTAAVRVPGLVSAYLSGLPQEHERGLGGWHAEAGTIAAIVQLTGSALSAMAAAVEHLRVDPDRMRANLASTRGVVFAEQAMLLLGAALGRDAAAGIVSQGLQAVHSGGADFIEALRGNPEVRRALAPDDLAALGNPDACLGVAETLRRRLIGARASAREP